MIKRLAIVITVLTALQGYALAASRVVTVQSIAIRPYEEVIRGFSSVCSETNTRVVLSDIPRDSFSRVLEESSPEVLLAVGLTALDAAATTAHVPVVFTMVLPQDMPGPVRSKDVTGVLMQVSAGMQLDYIVKVLPQVKRVGLLFDPKQSLAIAEEARRASTRMGVELLPKAVEDPKDISAALRQMKGRAEVIWMLPDITVSKPRVMELFTLFSLENRIPLVTFSKKYLENGALMSIEVNPFDMGRQAGDMANAILAGDDPASLPPRQADSPVVTINKIIADKFAVEIDETVAGAVVVTGRD